jgi:hypothetical protein
MTFNLRITNIGFTVCRAVGSLADGTAGARVFDVQSTEILSAVSVTVTFVSKAQTACLMRYQSGVRTHRSTKTTFGIGSTVRIAGSSVDGGKCAKLYDASPEAEQCVRTVGLGIFQSAMRMIASSPLLSYNCRIYADSSINEPQLR